MPDKNIKFKAPPDPCPSIDIELTEPEDIEAVDNCYGSQTGSTDTNGFNIATKVCLNNIGYQVLTGGFGDPYPGTQSFGPFPISITTEQRRMAIPKNTEIGSKFCVVNTNCCNPDEPTDPPVNPPPSGGGGISVPCCPGRSIGGGLLVTVQYVSGNCQCLDGFSGLMDYLGANYWYIQFSVSCNGQTYPFAIGVGCVGDPSAWAIQSINAAEDPGGLSAIIANCGSGITPLLTLQRDITLNGIPCTGVVRIIVNELPPA